MKSATGKPDSASNSADALAPVVIIAFNRPDHFRQTIGALAANPESSQTDVLVFVDGPRSDADQPAIDSICKCAEDFAIRFRKLELSMRPCNLGLCENITRSVTEVVNRYGAVIVLEDDIVVSARFLAFMNAALRHYRDEKRVWHIAAHTVANDEARPDETFLWRQMNCWGWATWSDRWARYERDPAGLVARFSGADIFRFNLDGRVDGNWRQVLANLRGDINTWDIFWYANIFEAGGLCLNPWLSYARNIGLDGSGVHSGASRRLTDLQRLNHAGTFNLPAEGLVEDAGAVRAAQRYFRPRKLTTRLQFMARKLLHVSPRKGGAWH